MDMEVTMCVCLCKFKEFLEQSIDLIECMQYIYYLVIPSILLLLYYWNCLCSSKAKAITKMSPPCLAMG